MKNGVKELRRRMDPFPLPFSFALPFPRSQGNQKRYFKSITVVKNRKVSDQKKIMLEGKEFVGFISLRLHQGTVKGMKLDTEQSFAAQNPSTEDKISVLHKYKRKR